MEKNLLSLALIYLAKGWSVIPVGKNKIPLISWKEYQKRKPTIEEVINWFFIFPDAQIGIVTGSVSNLTVIDIEEDGDFTLFPEDTYRVKTGGNGVHVYFEYEKGFKNAVRIFPSVDIRSEGGYVIASGSVSSKGSYTEINSLHATRMSEKTLRLFHDANLASQRILPSSASSGPSPFLVNSDDGLFYDGAGSGSRNDSMTKFAGALHAKLHPTLWSSVGWNLFTESNLKNTPPLPDRELENIWKSIGAKESSQNPSGRNYSSPQSSQTWGPSQKQDSDAPNVVSKEIIPENQEDPAETLHVSKIASLQKIDTEHTFSIGMDVFDDALLGGFSAGEVVVVAGQSGNGKTSIVQDWTVKLSSLNLPTLWFSYEVLAKPLWEKFKLMGADENTPIYLPRFNDSYDTEWVINVIEKSIIKWGTKVVCIDHLGFLRAPKGRYANAADAVTHTVRSLKILAVKYGLIILLPVHVRKTLSKVPDLNDIRESLGIAQEADSVFFIGREKDKFGQSTTDARLWLVKNRKTGIAVNSLLKFEFGRYFPHPDRNTQKKEEEDTLTALKAFDSWIK